MNLKIKYAFLTSEDDEPDALENFIAGYELLGGTWEGTIDIDRNIDSNAFTQEYIDEQINKGYDMLIRNTATNIQQIDNVLSSAIKGGLLPVLPAASNGYHSPSFTTNKKLYSAVFCGSGSREYGNATASPCMFFDKSDTEQYQEINEIRQCGTEYVISDIQRVSSDYMYIKLSGISDVRSIGIIEQGVPLYISTELSGTDIFPLPSGLIYTSNLIETAHPEYFRITHTTSAGTIGSYQSVLTGKLKYGITSLNEDNNKALIIRDSYNVDYGGTGITLKDITGFSNNPNGTYQVTEYINQDGYGNKIKISFNLGSGTYAGGGSMLYATQSYSTPYIAGQLAYIKDITGYDWYDVLGNAIVTSSNYSYFDTHSGYGFIRINKAVDKLIDKDLLTPEIILEYSQSGYIVINWNFIPFAKEYEIYFRGELIETVNAHILRYIIQPGAYDYYPNISASKKNYIKIRAKRNDEYSDFSNEVEYTYYYYTGILIK